MKFNRNIASLLAQPWAIRAASMAVMMEAFGYQHKSQGVEDMPMDDESEMYEVEDGIATIKISGIIGKKLPGWMVEMFGMCDVDTVSDMVRLANADASVKGILLDIDSPGGTVSGVPEVANTIRNSEKMVVSHTETLMASAGYWLGSGASGLFASSSALVGSVGVFIPVADMRRMYEMAGVEMEIIKAGDLKGAAYPGTSLSQAQREDFQRSVTHVKGKFDDFVTSRMGVNSIPQSALQGQDFYGDQAVDVGLIDGVMSRAEAIEALKKLA